MLALWIVIGVIGGALLATATTMAVIGLVELGNGVRFERCCGCGHWVPSPSGRVPTSCWFCHHQRLAHSRVSLTRRHHHG